MMASTGTHDSEMLDHAHVARIACYDDFTSYSYAGLAKLEVHPSH